MIKLTRVIKKWFTIRCDNCNEETELFLLRIAKSSSFLCQKCLDEVKREIEAAQILAYVEKQQAFLPEHLEQSTLEDLMDGETVYTVPWAMYAKKDSSLWLNGSYPFYRKSWGTSQLEITKKSGKYIVNIDLCQNEKWSKDGPGFVGNFTPIPVSELKG